MSKTYRIRTEVGVDRQVNIELEQDLKSNLIFLGTNNGTLIVLKSSNL